MKKLWIVYDRDQYDINSWFANRLLELLSGTFEAEIIMRESVAEPFEAPDVAVVRTIDPDFSERLEELGSIVINPARVSRLCNDKSLTYALAEKAEVAFPEIIDISGKSMPEENEYPVVVKAVDGHGGTGVVKCDNKTELSKAKKRFARMGKRIIAQKLVGDGRSGRDLRVYVLGGEIYKAVLRSSDSDFRSNFSLGGRAEPFELSAEDRGKVCRILKELGKSDLIGVDFLVSDGDLLFNEIEDVVGTRMLYAVYGIDAAAVFADYITKTYGLN